MTTKIDVSTERREYDHANLQREDLNPDPIAQFEQWLASAKQQGVRDATAMALATVDKRGMPFQRMVLLKGLDARGFVFFTNLGSRKASQLKDNPLASLHFAWLSEDRQVIINGKTTPLTRTENLRYFLTRPRESQLAAWASQQSHPISTRRILEEKYREIKAKYAGGDIELPKFWGGYRLEPESIEFWQGGEFRLHDRFLYQREADGWEINRLSP